MPSNESIKEVQANPLEPLEEILRWLVSTTVHVAIGVTIGMVAARVMRGRHLHWTWAATSLVPVLAGRSIIGETS